MSGTTKSDTTKSDATKNGISRRGFLKGAGITAAGSLILDSAQAISEQARQSAHSARTMGPGSVPVTLHVNGKDHALAIEPRTTLADALRTQLSMTGTKVVCDRGSCSACTVWLDKTPTLACMTLAIDVGDRKITTIEGMATGDTLHPVQAAFVKHDALQCGFCTPGMVMSCAALLERKANPNLDDVKQAVSGNLCRCGTYPKIFAATLEVAKEKNAAARLTSITSERGI